MKKISIITTSYNSAATIRDTLRSVNIQTYANIEHIVVDGASEDDTLAIVQAEGKRVALVKSERDKGIYHAYNKGIALATGDVVGFLNSDDFYCSAMVIEKVMAAFADESVEACHADLVYVDRNNTGKITRYWKSRSFKPGMFGRGFVPAHPTLFLRKSVYERAGGFNLNYRLAADYEFMLRIFQRLSIKSVYLPEIFVKMRTGGATGESFASIRKQNQEILKALRQHNVRCSAIYFFMRKILDRTAQRIRARVVRVRRVAA